MTHERPSRGIRQPLANDCLDGSTPLGRAAIWADVDRQLEVRERLAAILDELDAGEALIAAANVELLLHDLDGLHELEQG